MIEFKLSVTAENTEDLLRQVREPLLMLVGDKLTKNEPQKEAAAEAAEGPQKKPVSTVAPLGNPKVAPAIAIVDDKKDFRAFRQAVTTLLAENQKNNAFLKNFLAAKGFLKLSDVPEAQRKSFVQDLLWSIKSDNGVDDDDLPF